jgi:hypothetical protein
MNHGPQQVPDGVVTLARFVPTDAPIVCEGDSTYGDSNFPTILFLPKATPGGHR